ncbi:hypothetical protein V2J09_010316 [Rumex salicifolius]
MGHWEQFPMVNDEQSDSNLQIAHAPPLKRPKTSSDDDLGSSNPQINPPGKIFFKTRMCAKFRMGQCRNGENCNFAHGEDDRRQPPPNWQDLVSGRPDDNRNWEEDDKIIHRMKLCKKFYNGEECPYGERCNFLHKEPPKHRDSPNTVIAKFRESPRESSAISIGTSGPPVVQQSNGIAQFDGNRVAVAVEAGFDASRGNLKPVYWKTRMCTKWEITGHCPFGEKCHFAHGNSDLQTSGGRPGEQESVNQNSTALKPHIAGPLNQPVFASTQSVSAASNQEEQQRKKCLLKWNAGKKINSIYADWIDDMPLNMPNEVGV